MDIVYNSPLIPENIKGKEVNMEEIILENSLEEAVGTYNRACSRLLNPPLWHQLSGLAGAVFLLQSAKGEEAHRLAHLNDYIKIDIPGPGSGAGEGFDWVKLEAMQENTLPDAEYSLGIRVRACTNPMHKEMGTAHFFKGDATSTFIIKRNGNKVTASYHGRNELPNTTDVIMTDKIRNAVVAAGAIVGLSEIQWKALLKGFLQKEIGG